MEGTNAYTQKEIDALREALKSSEAIVVGTGAGISTSAGYTYGGERFEKYFFDFKSKYNIQDMYSGAFYNFASPEERWAFMSRTIYVNRYVDTPKDTYQVLYNLIAGTNFFVISTNVDHCFQRIPNFNKSKLFYTQGDYGLFQCSVPCQQKTYDNYEAIKKMILNQGFIIDGKDMIVTDKSKIRMQIDSNLIPKCPNCGKNLTTCLRADDKFVEDEGWHKASKRFSEFIYGVRGKKVLFLELGVGFNTPAIIKYRFWKETYINPKAVYCCINMGEAVEVDEIKHKSILINGDIDKILRKLT